MGSPQQPAPVLLLVAAFSRHEEALDWARGRATDAWGPIALESPRFDFVETDYYRASMGSNIKKCFWAFERLIDSGTLPALKIVANQWEAQYATLGRHAEPRPLNLDPGYLTPAKLVLATTKDFAHRLYLSDGIYAEITLSFRHGAWQTSPWTFPDYRRADYQEFFTACRLRLLDCNRKG